MICWILEFRDFREKLDFLNLKKSGNPSFTVFLTLHKLRDLCILLLWEESWPILITHRSTRWYEWISPALESYLYPMASRNTILASWCLMSPILLHHNAAHWLRSFSRSAAKQTADYPLSLERSKARRRLPSVFRAPPNTPLIAHSLNINATTKTLNYSLSQRHDKDRQFRSLAPQSAPPIVHSLLSATKQVTDCSVSLYAATKSIDCSLSTPRRRAPIALSISAVRRRARNVVGTTLDVQLPRFKTIVEFWLFVMERNMDEEDPFGP